MLKDLNYYMNLPYSMIIEHDPSGGFIAYIPELEGCITQAESKEEIIGMLEDAKRNWLETSLEEGFYIPEPAVEDNNEAFKLTLPKSLKRRLSLTAKEEGVSIEQMLLYIIVDGLKIKATV